MTLLHFAHRRGFSRATAALVPASRHHSGEKVVGELQKLQAPPLLDTHEPPSNQLFDVVLRHSRNAQSFVIHDKIAKAAPREKFFLDEGAHRLAEIRDATLVEIVEDLLLRTLDHLARDPGLAPFLALAVQLLADDAQECRLDFEVDELLVFLRSGDETHDAFGDVRSDDLRRLVDHLKGGHTVHASETKTVMGDSAHALPETFEIGKKILAERQKNFVSVAVESKTLCFALLLIRGLHLEP